MGIREEQEDQIAKFVSVRNLITGLAESESVALADAASFLLRKMIAAGEKMPRFIRQDSQSLTYILAPKEMDDTLRTVVANGEFDGALDDPTRWQSDTHGWFREEIKGFLTSINQALPVCCSPAWKPEPKRPAWLKAYENRQRVSLGEAVCLLTGVDPEDTEPFGINYREGSADIRRWKAGLIDAMNSGNWEIDGSSWSMNRDEQTMLHSGIKAWARDTNAPWPFLGNSPAPSPESFEGRILVRELESAKAQIAELNAELIETRRAASSSNAIQPTHLMAIAAEVQKRYWGSNYDPNNPESKTPQETIVTWIFETYQGMSDVTARAIEKVACPFDRNPSKKK